MIGDIIKDVYGSSEQQIRDLIEIPLVASCLFKSFDEFTQNLIFRLITNGGNFQRKQILSLMDRSKSRKQGADKFDSTMSNLQRLKIVTRSSFQNPFYNINHNFQLKLNEYMQNPFKREGQDFAPGQGYDKQFFNLLGLLRQNNQILRECKIGNLKDDGCLTKQNFDFIRLPIGYKISILIKGFLRFKKKQNSLKIIRDILCLSMLRCNKRYRIMKQKSQLVLGELQKIRLVKQMGDGYFIINEYLYNFAFAETNKDHKLLDCSIFVQTNFKVYTQIPMSNNSQNYTLIRDILQCLITIQKKQFQFPELIVGTIMRENILKIVRWGISVNQYLSFFRGYMVGDLNIQKDLGKWNKIHFLGLEGPSQELMIPNNVKQELKLWEGQEKNRDKIGNYGNFVEAEPVISQDENIYY